MGVDTLAVGQKHGIPKTAPGQMEPKTNTCGLSQFFNLEPHSDTRCVPFWLEGGVHPVLPFLVVPPLDSMGNGMEWNGVHKNHLLAQFVQGTKEQMEDVGGNVDPIQINPSLGFSLGEMRGIRPLLEGNTP